MAGIYIHIPFCRKKCAYCNFFSVASAGLMKGFTTALLSEISHTADYLKGETVETIYFGGGTPSLLPVSDIVNILKQIIRFHPLAPDTEITIEANPDDVNTERSGLWMDAGINRFSLGVQSFNDIDLQWLGRSHNATQSINAIEILKGAGFQNFSIDLIYGLPGQSAARWSKNIEMAVGSGAPHISAYSLTVEKDTILDKFIAGGKAEMPNDGEAAMHFVQLMEAMNNSGFQHYEISNFCRDGKISKHNSAYWNGKQYLGLGPSAHSFNGHSRQWNVNSVSNYIKAVNHGSPVSEKEILTPEQQFNEYVMVSLRTMWGCSLAHVESVHGSRFHKYLLSQAERFIRAGDIILENGSLCLTQQGKFFADRIASDLFCD